MPIRFWRIYIVAGNIAELQKLYKQTEELGHKSRANALLVKETKPLQQQEQKHNW